MDVLAPFGQGNPPPLFAEQSLNLVDTTPVGKMKEHLQVIVEDSAGTQTKLIWWNASHLPLPDGKFDLAYSVHSSNYRGQEGIQFEWVDFRQSSEPTSIEVRSKRKKIINQDYRRSDRTLSDLNHLLEETDVLVWSEGSFESIIQGVCRSELHPAKKLVVWSTPPSLAMLKELIKKVKPSNISWFLQSPHEHNLANFTRILSRIIKNGVNEHQVNSISSKLQCKPPFPPVSLPQD